MRDKILLATYLWLALCCQSLALSVEPQETLVSKENASDLGIIVSVFEDGWECKGLRDIYVNIPRVYKDSALNSVMLKASYDNQVVLETSLRVLTFQDYKGFKEFHGTNICLRYKSFETLDLTLSYGKGEVTTEVLLLPIMELM